jgi:hypothetical protein
MARALSRRGKRSLLDRVLGREPGDRPVSIAADEFRSGGEDIWKSLRF